MSGAVSQEELIETCESMDRYFQAGPAGNTVIAVVDVDHQRGPFNPSFEGLRDMGWYLSHVIPKEGGDFHILAPWGNPFNSDGEGDDDGN